MVTYRRYIRRRGPRVTARGVRFGQRMRSSYKPSRLAKKIKSISLAQSETKMSNQKEVGQELFHNLTHYYPNLLATGQGVTDPIGTSQDGRNRIGSEVKGVGLRIKNQIISAVTRPNCNYIIYIFWYRSNQVLNDTNFWSGPSGGGATNNRFLDHPVPNIYRIVKKIIIQNRNNYTQQMAGDNSQRVHTVYRETYIPLKFKSIKYDQDSTVPDPWTLGMAVTAFDANTTGQTDRLAYSNFATTFYFKDP